MDRRRLAVLGAALVIAGVARAAGPATAPPGEAVPFAALPGFAADDLAAAFATFRRSCIAAVDGARAKASTPPPPGLGCACSRAILLREPVDAKAAQAFFATSFEPRRVSDAAFLTGYYEPVVDGSPVRTAAFTAPLLAPPAASGGPLPDRAAIEAGVLGSAAPPLVWLRAPVDAFFVAIQGSARVRLPDGTLRRVAYAGRNGRPYTAIGRVLVARLGVAPSAMGMAQLRAWIEGHGQAPGEEGRTLMDENRSFIFFRFDDTLPPAAGPIGAAGISLTPLRSIAVDSHRWSYGLPVYIDAVLPWRDTQAEPFRRLMVAQDTGAAIVGPARADLFFGTGPDAARLAGPVRHTGRFFVLWPRTDAPKDDTAARAATP